MTADGERALRMDETVSSARRLERDQPELVLLAAEELRSGAEADRLAGTPRGRATVRRIQELAVERPDLGLAVARSLGLEHIAEELLEGRSVEGVPGIGPDGTALGSTPRDTDPPVGQGPARRLGRACSSWRRSPPTRWPRYSSTCGRRWDSACSSPACTWSCCGD